MHDSKSTGSKFNQLSTTCGGEYDTAGDVSEKSKKMNKGLETGVARTSRIES